MWMAKVRRVVVKVGTALLTGDDGQLDSRLIGRLVRQVVALHERGIRVTIVSSGAVGAGMGRTGMTSRPRSLPMLQAAAAVGQPALMAIYEKMFAKYGLHAGQVLVTRTDFEQRARYVNISNTIESLHRLKAIPIINENDTIAVDELDRFADNDTIAALVTNLLQADLMVLLTVVDGLLDKDGARVDLVENYGQARDLVHAGKSLLGSGGMAAKLSAARVVTEAGEAAVIACGREANVLVKLLDGQRVGTIFAPAARKRRARQRWIAGAVRPVGSITVDAGAVEAIHARGKSLLPRGIVKVEGVFDRGQIVRVMTPEGNTIAHGVSNYSSAEMERVKGLKSDAVRAAMGDSSPDEAIHRDNLVITPERD
jgi:glutamate 5-kinase